MAYEDRYEVYVTNPWSELFTCRTQEAIGVGLVQMAWDRWEAGEFSAPVLAIYDRLMRRWIAGPGNVPGGHTREFPINVTKGEDKMPANWQTAEQVMAREG